jgi:hypothetical protein
LFNEELDEMLKKFGEMGDAMLQMYEGASKGMSGDTAGWAQAFSGQVKIWEMMYSLFSKSGRLEREAEQLAKTKSNMLEMLQRQAKLINTTTGVEQLAAYEAVLNRVNLQLDSTKGKLMDMADKYMGTMDRSEWSNQEWLAAIESTSGKERENLQALYDQWIELQDAQKDYFNQWAEHVTGISLGGVVDDFLKALTSGERTVSQFADNVEDMLRNAIIQGFKTRYLVEALEPWYAMFAKMAGDEQGLTADELEKLRARIQAIMGDAADAFDALGDLGIDLTGAGDAANSLSGAIKGITENTASVIAGRLNAMHLSVNEHLRVAQRAVLYQAETASNTRELTAVRSLLVDIKTALSKGDDSLVRNKRAGGR